MKKFFANPNKLLNLLCAISSVLVFGLCVFSVVANFFGPTYEASTEQTELSKVELSNGDYNTAGGTTNKTKISFTKEADGTYGQTAILEMFNHIEEEINRAYTETGVLVETNGLVSAASMGVEVVQALSIKSSRDITGDIYYTEGTKEITSTHFGETRTIRGYVSEGKIRYSGASDVSASGNKVNMTFKNSNVSEKEYSKFLTENGYFVDFSPFSTITTNASIIDMSSCKMTESILGYTLSYNVIPNGNEFLAKYQDKFGYSAGAVSGTTSISRYSIAISLNKYGMFTSCETNFALKLKKNVMGSGVWADTTASLKSTCSYKNENFRVEKF